MLLGLSIAESYRRSLSVKCAWPWCPKALQWLCFTCETQNQWLLPGFKQLWSLLCWLWWLSCVSSSRRSPASPWPAQMGSGASRWPVSLWTAVSQTNTTSTQPRSTAARGPPLARNVPSRADLLLFWKVTGGTELGKAAQLAQTDASNIWYFCCFFRILYDILSMKNYESLGKVYLY